ncbi:MAG: hypothetical protein IJ500_03715 [Alphaproteobacteria bacterium]|nr:hypothetical protein [Alphaproteobacteria bacterium]MBQ8729480.1 hypothetical protein [Alphaproteobacteria bacterium]
MQGVYCKVDEATMNNFRIMFAGLDAKASPDNKAWNKARDIAKKIINLKKDVFYHVPVQWIFDYNASVWHTFKFPLENIFYDGRGSVMPNGKTREKISGPGMVNELVNCPARKHNVMWYDLDRPKASTLIVYRGFKEEMADLDLIVLADDVYQKMQPEFKDLGLELAAFLTVCAERVPGERPIYGQKIKMPYGYEHSSYGADAIGNVICRDLKTGKIVPVSENGVFVSDYDGQEDLYEDYAIPRFMRLLQENTNGARDVLLNQYKQKVK